MLSYINSTPSKFLFINNNKELDSVYMENEPFKEDSYIYLNFSFENKETSNEKEEIVNNCSLNINYSNGFCSSCISESSLFSLLDREYNDSDEKSDLLYPFNESIEKRKNSFSFSLELPKNKKKELIFKITYSPKHSLFTKTKVNNTLDEGDEKEESQNFLKQKRLKSRKENKDNIRKKIKRAFFNNVLCEKLKNKLRIIGSNQYFTKFPQFFASDVDRNRNKIILDMTLQEIFENSELYIYEDKNGYVNYLHNKKTVEKIKNNDIFKKILNKTFRELYEEFLDSDEFNIDEINRLKKSKMENDYIRRYKDIAKDLINFFCE